jgi:dTDP-4-dehydrorhamnose 3,5-epimerase
VKVEVEPTPLSDLVLVRHQFFDDGRGSFVEAYRRDAFDRAGLPVDFEQVNHSMSHKNVVRGLHMQWQPAMGKLMGVLSGRAYLVAVDIRSSSATLGRWFGIEIAGNDPTQVWAPAGFARGFCALEDNTCLQYFCTAVYNPEGEGAIRWNDPEIGIDWPAADPVVSDKDAAAPSLSEWLGTEGAVSLAS